MTKISNLLEKRSAKVAAFHSIAKEWQLAVIVAILAKFITAALSIFAGFHFFHTKFTGLFIPLLVPSISIGLLALLEAANMVAMEKGFKFAFRGRIKTAVFSFVAVFSFYSVSFYSSTEGIALYKAEKVTNKQAITVDYTQQSEQVKKQASERIKDIKQAIEPIKAYSWQAKRIEGYNKQIDSIRTELKQELKEIEQRKANALTSDQNQTDKTAKEYYNIIALIMLLQLAANAAVMGFHVGIYKQTEHQKYVSEEIEAIRQDTQSNYLINIRNDYVEMQNRFLHALQMGNIQTTQFTNQLPIPEPKEVPGQRQEEIKEESEPITQKQIIGFQSSSNTTDTVKDVHRNTESVEMIKVEHENGIPHKNCTHTDGAKFFDEAGHKLCPNCGQPVNRKHWAAVYCSDNCKTDFWEKKTGRNLSQVLKNKHKS